MQNAWSHLCHFSFYFFSTVIRLNKIKKKFFRHCVVVVLCSVLLATGNFSLVFFCSHLIVVVVNLYELWFYVVACVLHDWVLRTRFNWHRIQFLFLFGCHSAIEPYNYTISIQILLLKIQNKAAKYTSSVHNVIWLSGMSFRLSTTVLQTEWKQCAALFALWQ